MIEVFKDGGPVMYPLLLCSVVSLTVIFERFFFWINVKRHYSQDLLYEVLELCQEGDWDSVKSKTIGSKNYVIKILVSGILHREFSLIRAMESEAAEEIRQMRRFMGILDTIITAAPLMGIFGTVIGIIMSFDMLGFSGLENPQAITKGIAQALITTASGLGIAILTLFPYNYFNSKIEQAALNIEKHATSLEIVHEKSIEGTQSQPPQGDV